MSNKVERMNKDSVDSYIEGCKEFAQPILNHLRKLINDVIPEIDETIKWAMPSFDLNGKIVCSIAGYKKHCVLRFWKGSEINDSESILLPVGKTEMRHIGNISRLDQLPNDVVLKKYIKEAKKITSQL